MKCLALFSGGLDSMLSMKLMSLQGIEVIALNMNIGFGSKSDLSDIKRRRAKIAGASFEVIDVRESYIKEVLFNPIYGYGKNFNPCIDCHGFMFKSAKNLLKTYGASFLITGEVIGQRPMSQRVNAIKSVTKLAGDEDNLILRPLCAKLMEPTKPEIEGWVDREKLFGISGRSREVQLSLAQSFGWDDFEKPGGGCLLTDVNFTKRMRDFIKFDKLDIDDIDVLKNGRQLRLPEGAKLIIGKNEVDNERIDKIKTDKYLFLKATNNIPGPSALLRANATEDDKKLALRIVLSFSRTDKDKKYDIICGENLYKESPHQDKQSLYQYYIT